MALELQCNIRQATQSADAARVDTAARITKPMRRREFLRATTGAAGLLAAPSIGRAADTKVLRFVPQANLANLDPIWTTQYVVRNGSLLIWDMLYGVNDKLEPQPQMVEGHEVDATSRPGHSNCAPA